MRIGNKKFMEQQKLPKTEWGLIVIALFVIYLIVFIANGLIKIL